MAKLPRVTNKLFAENAATDDIGQFGSANAGTKLNTSDVTTIQALPAWQEGWKPAVVGGNRYPALQERNGVDKVFSYQIDYMLQQGIPEYDAGTTYYKGSIIKSLDTNEKPVLYNSLVDDNVGNPLSDGTKWEKLSLGGGGLELCDIGMSLYIDETLGLRRRLNGQILVINSNTQAFLNRLKSIIALYPSLVCTESEWQTAKTLSAFGQVGKFVLNYATDGTTVESVRLPAVVNIQGLLDLSKLGLTVEAGLPNITGTICDPLGAGAGAAQYTGAFKYTSTINNSATTSALDYDGHEIIFDASLSNSIYGNSTTVQPEVIQYPYFIQIATGQETKNNIINDIELNNPYTLFDSKYADKSLYNASWLLSNGQWNAKTVYITAYEGLVVENNTAISAGTTVTLPSGTSYTKRGLSVKLSTETYTDFDFILNTGDETFRLPLKNKLASGSSIVNNETSSAGLQLYYYLGETVQNAILIDAGRIGEQLVNKVDSTNTKWAVNACMPDYTRGVTFAVNTPVQAPYDCVVFWTVSSIHTTSNFLISPTGEFTTEHLTFPFYMNNDGYTTLKFYVPKGYYFKSTGNIESNTFSPSQYFPFKGGDHA